MTQRQELFSIGEITRAAGVTRRMILNYEEHGLIRPDAYCLRCNNAIRTIWGGASYKLSDSACPHTLYMIQDPYEDQLVPANDYTHLQGQAHTSLCADATEARRIKGWC